jgi:NAD(P)-dependent dehydrogenase (short-subunit alcohol dehydrogenase family)
MSLFDLAGKTAIITGSSRGIGRAIAEQFAAHGANVVISSRKAAACEEVADAINAKGQGRAIAIPASISDKAGLEAMVAKARAEFGPITILVANAASNPYYGPMAGISDDAFRKILDNNILSNHWLTQACLPDMMAAGEGSIIIVSSIGGLKGSDVLGVYCVSKAADMQLARNYAVEYGQHGIRANCIAPGLIQTDMARALWENEETAARYNANHPMRRIGQPVELAGAALLLASRAGTYINGQTIVVDGGATILGV